MSYVSSVATPVSK